MDCLFVQIAPASLGNTPPNSASCLPIVQIVPASLGNISDPPPAPATWEDGRQSEKARKEELELLKFYGIKEGKGFSSTLPEDDQALLNTREKNILDVHYRMMEDFLTSHT